MQRFVHTLQRASKSITLAHMSDIHIWQPQHFETPVSIGSIIRNNRLRDMKLLQGYLNVAFNRGPDSYDQKLFTTALSDMATDNLDHLMITGDITNISLNDEFAYARKLLNEYYLKQIMKNANANEQNAWRYCSAIPGNHDTYTPSSVEQDLFGKHFGDILGYQFAPNITSLNDRFPAVKVIQTQCKTTRVVILSLISGVPTKPFVAAGHISKQQLDHASKLLAEARQGEGNTFTILLMHHPPIIRYEESWSEKLHGLPEQEKRLVDEFCTRDGIDLLLHGHTHQPYKGTPLSNKKTTVIDNGSSTYKHGEKNPVGRHHVYTIEGDRMVDCYARVWNNEKGLYEKREVKDSASPTKKTKVR
jgi:3',5'-cyclic AMP phosphodiesterase CpdA